MGITIEADPESKGIVVLLCCDGDDHGLFPSATTFRHPDGFVGCHKLAMASGWLEHDAGERGRVWLGPCCSGKAAKVSCETSKELNR
jgi:hypothetical protein